MTVLSLSTAGCFPSLPADGDEKDVSSADVQVEPDVANTDVKADEDIPVQPDVADLIEPPMDTAETTNPLEDTVTPPEDVADTSETTVPDDTDAGPELNACGGTGVLVGEALGSECGACSDGETVCDPDDTEKNRTICDGATALNDCGGCGALTLTLGDDCNECGTVACDSADTGRAVCVEPVDGCEYPLTCVDLNCTASSRECTPETATEDAVCGACVAGFVDVAGTCLRATTTPTNVAATRDLADKVTITWDAMPGATAYRVYRCNKATGCVEADWSLLPNGEVATTSYDDTTATGAAQPGAPTATATTNVTTWVDVSWPAVTPPAAAAYNYRVLAVAPAGNTDPSGAVVGSRASHAVQSYEVSIDGGAWIDNGTALTFRDAGALAPTLNAGTATASQGTSATHVALALSGTSATPGVQRAYRVRAVTASGTGTISNASNGRRAAPGAWTIAWERSSGASAENFSTIPNATSNTYNDTDAPSDGSVRYYRAVVSANGAVTGNTTAVAGARLPPPGVPGSVGATTNLEDRVTITWNAVQDAIGYRVYRNGTLLTTGNALTGTSYDDTTAPAPASNWAAPTGVSATTNNSAQVSVTWTAPSRPLGATAEYQVLAVNAAGDGPKSGIAVGRRARPALTGYQVETSWSGSVAAWTATQSTSAGWTHANAPAGTITVGTATASQGDFKTRVALEASGYSASPTQVSYRVRGVLEGGTYTPIASAVTGYRATGTLSTQWQVSTTSGTTAAFTNISGATAATYDHTDAPVDGSKRYYRMAFSAPGVTTNYSATVEGWRLAVASVAVGVSHACAVMTDGAVWCWGNDFYGQLGNGDASSHSNVPVRVATTTPMRHVAVDQSHTCAVTTTGGVQCWGANAVGQLGTGTSTPSQVPVSVSGITTATQVSAGGGGSCARLNNATVRCWGANAYYQLGNGATTDSTTPVSVRKSSGVTLGSLTFVSRTVDESPHTCASTASNSIYCWGYDASSYEGQLGVPEFEYNGYPLLASATWNSVEAVTTGGLSSCAIVNGGQLWCWGYNAIGQLATGDYDNRYAPTDTLQRGYDQVALGLFHGCGRKESTRSIYCWGIIGGISSTTPKVVTGISEVDAIASGPQAMCAVSNYSLYCWGQNSEGILGTGTSSNSNSPALVHFPE